MKSDSARWNLNPSALAPLSLLALLASTDALAFGKKKTEPTDPCANGGCLTTPKPARKVRLTSVRALPFQLPNGSRVSLGTDETTGPVDPKADLDSMLVTSSRASGGFLPTFGPTPTDPCERFLELSAAVTSFELNAWELNLTFGYKPSGEIDTVTDLKGKVKVRVGSIQMDFAAWECRIRDGQKECSAHVVSKADQSTFQGKLEFEIDFDQVHSGIELMKNTVLGEALSQIMTKGIYNLARSPDFDRLPWSARLQDFDPRTGILVIEGGTLDQIKPHQAFEILGEATSSSSCPVYSTLAYVHTTRVDSLTSNAIIDSTFGREPKESDRVVIHVVPARK